MFSLKKQRQFYISEIVQWILPFCSNIHTLILRLEGSQKGLHNEIARLEKLINLDVWIAKVIHLKEVILQTVIEC